MGDPVIVPRCPARTRKGAMCAYPAGLGTTHPGYGTCNRHHGAWPQSETIWADAMEISKREDITPQEAMIGLVQVAMGRAAWVDGVLADRMRRHVADGGSPLNPPADIKPWLSQSRQERKIAAQTAKAAVDAGVMQVLARRLDLEGGLVADALTAALDVLGLSQDQRMAALTAAQEKLLNVAD